MSGGAIAFMAVSWIGVLSLTVWSFKTLLADKKHFDPDGVGPLEPPEPPHAKTRKS
ncbi:MAG: hypothetical protein ACK5XT_00140 [Gemmatimonas sp.]|jgi:hypothetical protein|uniref:hypothetical protein n=1 Tax=Gemmatimonas sp. TaxID=1962908 RepID=UPI00391F8766|nr:hypothetical protein [Gemmatimonadota bacterium]